MKVLAFCDVDKGILKDAAGHTYIQTMTITVQMMFLVILTMNLTGLISLA